MFHFSKERGPILPVLLYLAGVPGAWGHKGTSCYEKGVKSDVCS